MNNPLFLIAGYGITFMSIVAYLMRLRRLEDKARQAVEADDGRR